MKTSKISVLVILFFFIGGNVSIAQSKKELRKQKKQEEYLVTKKLVENGRFVFVANWVLVPQENRIEISGEGLLIEDDKTYANLPFIGSTYKGIIGGDSIGIEFSTSDTEYDIKYNDKKKKIILRFQATHKAEHYNINLTIQSNGKTVVQVLCSSRSNISYEGIIKKVNI